MAQYGFNAFAVPPLVVALASLAIGLFVLGRERGSRVSWMLLAATVAIAVWFGSSAGAYLANDPAAALRWMRIEYIAVPMLPTLLYLYGSVALRTYRYQRPLLAGLATVSTIFVVLAQRSDLLLKGVQQHWWGYYPVYSAVGPVFIGFFALVLLLAILQLRSALRESPHNGPFRPQLSASLASMGILSLGCVDFPAKFGIELYPFGYIPIAGFLAITLFLETRHRVVYMTPAIAAETVLATMQGAVLVTTADGAIEVANNAAVGILGYSDSGLTAADLERIFPPETSWRGLLAESLASPQGVIRDREMVWLAEDGSPKMVSVSVSAVRKGDGRAPAFVLVATDIGDRKRAESELRDYNARLESIHELDQRILAAESPRVIAEAAVEHLTALIPHASASVVEYDYSADTFSVIASSSPRGELLERPLPTLSAMGVRRTAEAAPEIWCRGDISIDPDPELARRRLTAEGVGLANPSSYLRISLVTHGEVMGALSLGSPGVDAFGEREIAIARVVSDTLAIALNESVVRDSLRDAEKRYRTLFEGVPVGLFRADCDGTLVDVNAELSRMLGHTGQLTSLGSNVFDLCIGAAERARLREMMEVKGLAHDFEMQVAGPAGIDRWIQIDCQAVHGGNGSVVAYEGSIRDVTARKQMEQRLVHDALHDPLTGLPNRSFFLERLRHSIAFRSRRSDYLYAVIFMDCDRFKAVNDNLGHTEGDSLLKGVAERLRTCLRQVDSVARLGGDEFAILLDDICEAEDARLVAERVQASLVEPFRLGGRMVHMTASIGIALGDSGYTHPEDILRDADIAMYKAKASGGGRSEVFDSSMRSRVAASETLEANLRRALHDNEFRLCYQPIVSLDSGRITSLEALLRWKHPDRGLLPPAEFLHPAEEVGMAPELGAWVLGTACAEARVWNDLNPALRGVSVSVNLSERQFRQPGLDAQVFAVLRETGLDPDRLILEVAEDVVMADAHATRSILMGLKALGVGLEIDDFGTGFSSLSLLHDFPIRAIKIDRSLVTGHSSSSGGTEVMEAIISVAHALHLEVVAEGVETEEQLRRLRQLGCEKAQGYLFSPPVTPQAARSLLTGCASCGLSAPAYVEEPAGAR